MKNVRSVPVHHYTSQRLSIMDESIAVESLLRISVNGSSLTNLLGSPEQARELVLGHLMTQYGLRPHNIKSIAVTHRKGSVDAEVKTDNEHDLTQRPGVVTSSCGACDLSNLNELVKDTPVVTNPSYVFEIEALMETLHTMRDQQTGFQLTGGMHAAGLYAGNGTSLVVMEDIGRHNAVDKAYGAWYEQSLARPNVLLLSGRCGWDIVATAAAMATPIVVSFGAASSLAIETARASNMTLITFVKGEKAIIIGPVEGRFHRKH
ncbi:MAG: formate dehydrogenase accessory sulfurtransferase FdhD [Candidatus Poseidoniales archaeon]